VEPPAAAALLWAINTASAMGRDADGRAVPGGAPATDAASWRWSRRMTPHRAAGTWLSGDGVSRGGPTVLAIPAMDPVRSRCAPLRRFGALNNQHPPVQVRSSYIMACALTRSRKKADRLLVDLIIYFGRRVAAVL